jgi:glutathione reductase (NADPH)
VEIMRQQFDLVCIGTGSAASTIASRLRAAGWSVGVVDKRPFGGTCGLRGCDPKKVLVGAADVVDWARRMKAKGVGAQELSIQWPELMQFKRTFTDTAPQAKENIFRKAGIVSFHGPARFTGSNTLAVNSEILEAKFIVIATGMKPALLGIPGEDFVTISDQFLELETLPRRIIFIGGGYISMEFAHVAAIAGAQVTIVHSGRRPLEGFDPDLVTIMVTALQQRGIDIQLDAKAEAVEPHGHLLRLTASRGSDKLTFDAEMIVHGAGRVPEIDDLDLVAGNIEWDRRGVKVNNYLQSVSNARVYSAGDAAASGNPPLSPLAGYEGRVVAENLQHGNREKADPGAVPTVAFTIPPIASVGLREEQAIAAGTRFRKTFGPTQDWYSSRRIAESHSGFKILIDENTDQILGAHLLGHNAEELINLFTIAIQAKISSADLRKMIFAYPTHASNVQYML